VAAKEQERWKQMHAGAQGSHEKRHIQNADPPLFLAERKAA